LPYAALPVHTSHMSHNSSARFAGSPGEVFRASLRLGLTSFGGPIAHLGYYERVYVRERCWLNVEEYAGIVALCQLLPGPASSQVNFLIGWRRAGWFGAVASWVGFTLPSALLMYLFAMYALEVHGPQVQAVLHGFMLSAVAVVAQAVTRMARMLCPDRERIAIALVAAALLLAYGSVPGQFVALGMGGIAGIVLYRKRQFTQFAVPSIVTRRPAWIAFAVFCALLVVLPVLAALAPRSIMGFASILYRSGAVVFGGGHVALPLLREALVPIGWVSDETFLSGYGFAQGLPGPLFSFAAFLGAVSAPVHASLWWAAVALVALFLPGLLLAIVGASLWTRVAHVSIAQASLAGINAAVVGVLGAALYNPIWITGIHSSIDVAVAIVGFALLERWQTPPILVVALCILVGIAAAPMH
jgi:chromate transporter